MRRVDEYMEANRANWDRTLVARSGDDATFVESDVYDAASALGGEQFDPVFTGIGALCWLPSISRWAATVSAHGQHDP